MNRNHYTTQRRAVNIDYSSAHVICMADVEATSPPVLPAYKDKTIGLHFLCFACGLWHHHGDGGQGHQVGDIAGHRIAHCGPWAHHTLLYQTGYVLQVAGEYTPAMREDANRRERRMWRLYWAGQRRASR